MSGPYRDRDLPRLLVIKIHAQVLARHLDFADHRRKRRLVGRLWPPSPWPQACPPAPSPRPPALVGHTIKWYCASSWHAILQETLSFQTVSWESWEFFGASGHPSDLAVFDAPSRSSPGPTTPTFIITSHPHRRSHLNKRRHRTLLHRYKITRLCSALPHFLKERKREGGGGETVPTRLWNSGCPNADKVQGTCPERIHSIIMEESSGLETFLWLKKFALSWIQDLDLGRMLNPKKSEGGRRWCWSHRLDSRIASKRRHNPFGSWQLRPPDHTRWWLTRSPPPPPPHETGPASVHMHVTPPHLSQVK